MIWRYTKRFLAAAVLCAMVAAGVGLVLAQSNGSQLLSVQSRSMAPALDKGDLVTVTRVPAAELAVGDVVTFMNPQNARQTITHRVVQLPSKSTNGLLVTKGDANAVADTPISPSAVVGKVSRQIPLAGYAIDSVRKPLGLLLIIYIPALIIIAQEFRRLTRYYKKMRPYRAPGREARREKITGKQRVAAGAKLGLFCLVIGMSVAIPVKAALVSEVQLTNNSITTLARTSGHVLFRRAEFKCSPDNTEAVNKLPEIFMYNPANEDVNTAGWYIESSEGRIVTFRPQTVFDARADYDIEPDLQAGVHYEGDYLALYDNNGTLVDAISWGTDTTHLNPALPGTQDGTIFRRIGLVFDTNTAVDWSVSVNPCASEE